MSKFKGGPEEAAKMLQGLGPEHARKLIDEIRSRDPQMAELLEKNLVTFEDLKYLTQTMLIGLLRDVKMNEFGLALRGVDKEVVSHILSMVSTNIRLEIEDELKGPPRPISEVQRAQSSILEIVRKKIEAGQIVLDKDGSEKLD